MPPGWLTAREERILAALRGPRAAEWAASRTAAKASVLRLVGSRIDPSGVEITGEPSGVPWGRIGGDRLPLSLAHSDGWAAAAAHRRLRVGVDIEPLRPLPDGMARYFLSPDEDLALGGWTDPPTATLAAWTLKEAALKAAGRGLSVPPRSIRIRSLGSGGRAELSMTGQEFVAACWRDGGAVVAVACAATRLPAVRIFSEMG
ncbi:MAG: 4'-phosphopantetheinyl transferase family protein [Actinomycetota bacterium]